MFLLLASTAFAQPDVPSVSDVPAAPGPIVFDADERLTVDSEANDLFAMGQELSIAAPISDNLFGMAQWLDVEHAIGGDAMLMGERVRLSAPVSGDVYAVAKRLEIEPGAAIGGHLHAFAAEVILEGPVGGDVQITGGKVELAAAIGGDANLTVHNVEVGDGAAVGGTLRYQASDRFEALEAVVGGDVFFEEVVPEPAHRAEWDLEEETEERGSLLGDMLWSGLWMAWSYVSKLIVGVVLLALGGAATARVGHALLEEPGKAVGLGFVIASVVPVASLLAFVTILPIPLGVVGFSVWGIALYLGSIFAALAVGELLLQRIQPGAIGSPYVSLAVGLVPLVFVFAIPWLGTIAWLGVTLAGIGAAWVVVQERVASA